MISSYNKTWHSGIQSEPVNVNKNNEKKLWWQMYWPDEKTNIKKTKKQRSKKRMFVYKFGDK